MANLHLSPRSVFMEDSFHQSPVVHSTATRLTKHAEMGTIVCTLARHVTEIQRQCTAYGYSDMKAIVTIRRQDTKLASSYAEISSSLRKASQKDFERWVHRLLSEEKFYRRSGGSKLNYDWFYDCIVDEIGKENVFFLPYEALKTNSSAYIDAWCDVLNTTSGKRFGRKGQKRVNKKSTGSSTWAISAPSYLGPRFRPHSPVLDQLGIPNRLLSRWFDWSRGNSITLTDELTDFIIGRYSESNNQLNGKIRNFDLQEFGYC